MLSDTDVEDHYSPSVRLIQIERNGASCGFKLTRGKWDPYPWVSSVDHGTAAHAAGLKPGDCLLEVNGEDIVGLRISEVAEIVKSNSQVSLLLWNAGADVQCTPESMCCGPMPMNLQRLSVCMSSILSFLECPICLDTISPPTFQCGNGHLICIRCRAKSERCPVCRLKYTRGRSLLSDQIYGAVVDAFSLREDPAKMREIFKLKNKNKSVPEIKVTPSHTSKFLARIVGKASSVENLTDPNAGYQLKAKSLSTQEIFETSSPMVSRTNSTSRLSREKNINYNYLNAKDRSASCHGSFESLQRTIEDEDLALFHCPFDINCTTLIKGNTVIEHFQMLHDGPLIQYFKPHLSIDLAQLSDNKNLNFVIHIDEKLFFVNIEHDDGDEKSLENIAVWSWMMSDKKASLEYDLQVVLCSSSFVIGSARHNVFSLQSISYAEIKKLKKGVRYTKKVIASLNQTDRNITMNITILKTDGFL